MTAAIRRTQRGQGAQPPALLDTSAQLRDDIPEHRENARLSQGVNPVDAASKAVPRANPWKTSVIAAKERTRDRLAHAYEVTGRELRAANVALCGAAGVAYEGTTGEMLRGKSKVPTAVVSKCGCRLCTMGCGADVSRRQRTRILRGLKELELRERIVGPLRHPKVAKEAAKERRKAFADADVRGSSRGARARRRIRARSERVAMRGVEAEAEAMPADELAAALIRQPRRQRRPPHGGVADVEVFVGEGADGRRLVCGVRRGPVPRRTWKSFRVGIPPGPKAYGCRFLTLSQPGYVGEALDVAIERLEDARARLTRSATWLAHVDAAVIRLEFEWSTPESREDAAKEHEAAGRHAQASEIRARASSACWWHVHLHLLLIGRHWPWSPSWLCKKKTGTCTCTACEGVDDEDSLLVSWRRALVDTGRYSEALGKLGFSANVLRATLRRHAGGLDMRKLSDAWTAAGKPGTWPSWISACVGEEANNKFAWLKPPCWARDLEGVRFGGGHIKTPSRDVHGSRVSSWGAICEVVKYCTKTMKLGKLSDDKLVEVVNATTGRRLVRCTGLLYGLHVDDDDPEETQRQDVEGLETEVGIGDHAFTPDGRVVDTDEMVWRFDDAAVEERRAALEQLHDAFSDARAVRMAESVQQRAPQRRRMEV